MTLNKQNNNCTLCNTKYKFSLKSLRSKTIVCTDKDRIVILHHLKQHFIIAACQQVCLYYFKC